MAKSSVRNKAQASEAKKKAAAKLIETIQNTSTSSSKVSKTKQNGFFAAIKEFTDVMGMEPAPNANPNTSSSEKSSANTNPAPAENSQRSSDLNDIGVTVQVDAVTRAILKQLESAVSNEEMLLKLTSLEKRFDELEEGQQRTEKLLKKILEKLED